jgi:hypothetical protein
MAEAAGNAAPAVKAVGALDEAQAAAEAEQQPVEAEIEEVV